MGRVAAFFSVTSQQLKSRSGDGVLRLATPGSFFSALPTCLCHSEVRAQAPLTLLLSEPAWSYRDKDESWRRSLGTFRSKGGLTFRNSKRRSL